MNSVSFYERVVGMSDEIQGLVVPTGKQRQKPLPYVFQFLGDGTFVEPSFGDAQGGIYVDEMMGIALRDEAFVVGGDEGETVAGDGGEVGETVVDVRDDDLYEGDARIGGKDGGEERPEAGPGAVRADEDVGCD
jgi:hypothetical protein